MQIPTVRIEDGKGDYIIINETDFDKSKHKIFVEKEKKEKEPKEPKEPKVSE